MSAKPAELETVSALGLDQLSIGQNVCVGRSSSTGKSYVWGENHGGSIVKDIEGDLARPQQLGVTSLVAAGWDSIWIINEEGTVANGYGKRNASISLDRSQKSKVSQIISSAFQTIFLRADGSMLLHNDRKDVDFQNLDFNHSVTQIARGWSHFLFLDSSGSVWSIGANKHGQCGLGHTNTVLTYAYMDRTQILCPYDKPIILTNSLLFLALLSYHSSKVLKSSKLHLVLHIRWL